MQITTYRFYRKWKDKQHQQNRAKGNKKLINSSDASQASGMRYIGIEELSVILGRSPATVRTQVSRQPEKLPPQPKNRTSSQVRWLLITVWKWMLLMEAEPLDSDTTNSPSSPKKRRGAPTRKEKVDAQNAGMSVSEFRMANSK